MRVSEASALTPLRERIDEPRQGRLRRRALDGHLPVGGLVFLSAVVNLLFIGRQSLDGDEFYSATVARLSWSGLYHAMRASNANMSLYYVLLHFWTELGTSETVLRSLSAVFATATVPVVYWLGRRLFGARIGLVAGLLLALNGFFVYFAQEARSYSLLLLMVSISSCCLVIAVERRSSRAWCAYGAVSCVAVGAHFIAVFVVAAQLGSLAFLPRRSYSKRAVIGAVALVTAVLAALAVALNATTGELYFVPHPGLRTVAGVASALSGGGGPVLLVAMSVACLLALPLAVRAWRTQARSLTTWRYALVVMWLVVPAALSLAASVVQPVFTDRYLIVSLTPLVLLAAVGLCSLAPRQIAVVASVLLLALTGSAMALRGVRHPKADLRGVARYVLARSSGGDAILFHDRSLLSEFNYYRSRSAVSGRAPSPILPSGRWRDFGRHRLAPAALAALQRDRSRVWLVLQNEPPRASLADQIGQVGRLRSSRRFSGPVLVRLYEIVPPGTTSPPA